MKAPSERAPRGKYAGGVLENIGSGKQARYSALLLWSNVEYRPMLSYIMLEV